MKTRGRTRRRTRRDVEVLLGRYHQSGMTVRAFSEAEKVPESSLYKWLRRERAKTPTPALVEVTTATGTHTAFSIDTPQGYHVEVPSTFSVEALTRLLGVLQA